MTVVGLNALASIEVFDALGQRFPVTRDERTLAVGTYPEGVYFLRTMGRTFRFVVQH
jgi:hypothetical protein